MPYGDSTNSFHYKVGLVLCVMHAINLVDANEWLQPGIIT
jgi:hypothetical protein